MLHYISNGKEVNLSADLSTEFYVKNPLLTKEGEYTLDIDIDLRDPQNAFLYEHCHRIDHHAAPSGRRCVLYDERGVIIAGTEVILEINDKKVKVQVVGGSSEMNFFSKNMKIRDLDLGTIDTDAMDNYNAGEHECPAVLSPVMVNVADATSGPYPVPSRDMGSLLHVLNYVYENGGHSRIANPVCFMPFVWYLAECLVQALGYSVGMNHIYENQKLKWLVMVHGYSKELRIAYMLPNWDVQTFVTEIEKFCNVSFLVDSRKRTIDIVDLSYYYGQVSADVAVAGDDVLEGVYKKIDSEESETEILTLYDNVSYSFPSTYQYKYASLEKALLDKADMVNVTNRTQDETKRLQLYNVWRHINNADSGWETDMGNAATRNAYDLMNIYKDPTLNMCWVLRYQPAKDEEVDFYDMNESFYLQRVNHFGSIVSQDSGNSINLKIVPCEMAWLYRGVNYRYPLPIARNSNYVTPSEERAEEEETENEMNQDIRNGVKEETVEENIFVGFYFSGYNYFDNLHVPVVSPSDTVVLYRNKERLHGNVNGSGSPLPDCETAQVVRLGNRELTLALDGEYGMMATTYGGNVKFDADMEYTIRFRCINRPDPRSIFIINNIKFFCKELKYSVVNCQTSEIVEGVFYPAKD